MIYINFAELKLSEAWEKDAEEAQWMTRCTCPTTRNMMVDAHSNIWRDARIKNALKKLSNGKCWYCESKDLRADKEVEHFRPKNEVKERKGEHKGYWWLAFNYKNYKYSCTFCNQIRVNKETKESFGKGTFFPIFNEDGRAMTYGDDHSSEDVCLLDPTLRSDTMLLSFNDDGSATPRHTKDKRKRLYERARISINLYNLNHPDIKEARLAVAEVIEGLIDDGEKYFDKMALGEDTAMYAFERTSEMIAKLIHSKTQFAGFARAILKGHKDKEWVEDLIMAH